MNNKLIKKACVIDDDKLYVSLVQMLISKNDIPVELIVFENGKLAFDYFNSELKKVSPDVPEVILLDLNMPVMDGWEFLEMIESFMPLMNTRLNVVSSTINPAEVKKVQTLDFVHSFMTKPINKEALIEAFSIGQKTV